MKSFSLRVSLLFAAGALGGAVKGLALALYQSATAREFLGAKFTGSFQLAQLAPDVAAGGLWAMLFLVPLRIQDVFLRGAVVSLGPTLFQLLVTFPSRHQGLFGYQLGPLTWLETAAANLIWGLTAALWLRLLKQA